MWMKKIISTVLLLGVSLPGWGEQICTDQPPQMEKKRFVAIGYGAAIGDTEGQRQLMAIRAGKMDAYRAMAERVHGFRISGSTTVSSMMVKSDNFRIYVDAQLRGAKLVSVQPMTEDTYEVTMELEMNLPVPGTDKKCVDRAESDNAEKQVEQSSGAVEIIEKSETVEVVELAESKATEEPRYHENFLTKLVHAVTDPILSPQKSETADLDQYETVPPADRITYQRGAW